MPPPNTLCSHVLFPCLRGHTIIPQVMTSAVDAKAAFKSMVVSMGLEGIYDKLEKQGWDTFWLFRVRVHFGNGRERRGVV